MKRFFKVLRVIFSIIGFLVTTLTVWALIVFKSEGCSVRKFYKDWYVFVENYDYEQ